MTSVEEPIMISCMGMQLLGILHRPAAPQSRAVLIVVGGPQYRVGSHRQFLLLARYLSERGTPVLRFDYRGMGDSPGAVISFEETEPDIRAGVDALYHCFPDLTDVVVWGLCDAASAAMMYAHQDTRISGLVLANPWVRNEAGIENAYLQRYYKSQILDPKFWGRLFTGKVRVRKVIGDFFKTAQSAWREYGKAQPQSDDESAGQATPEASYVERMRLGLERFDGEVLLIISGADLTAAEFDFCVEKSRHWRDVLRRPTLQRRDLIEANHTFSRQDWRDQVACWTDEWLKSW